MIPLVLVSFIAFAQNGLENFKIEDGTIIWQKVYTFPEADTSMVKAFFYQNANFTKEGNILKAYPLLKDYTNVGHGQRPIYFNEVSRIRFVVQIKENRYRITLQSLEPIDTFIRGNTSLNHDNAKYLSNFLTTYIKSNGEIKNSFYRTATLLEESLSALFDYSRSATKLLDDDF